MSKHDSLSGNKKYALLVPAVALASLGLVSKASAGSAPSLTNSAPVTATKDKEAAEIKDLLPELGANGGLVALANGEFFEDNGTADPEKPVEVLAGGESQPVLLDLVAEQGTAPSL